MIDKNFKSRVIALVLLLSMLLGMGISMAEESFQPVVVSISWKDEAGDEKSVSASSVLLENHQNSFWLHLPAEAVGKEITISILDKLGQYQHGFSIRNGTNIAELNYIDAGDSIESVPVKFSAVSENGESLIDFFLYISSSAEAPKEMSVPSEAPTEAPTEVPTEESTEEPTEASTEVPTEAPAEVPTEDPTEVPTEEPTEEPTEVPTEEPTEEPTEAPVEEPKTVDVPVRYMDMADGVDIIEKQSVKLIAGQSYELVPNALTDYVAVDEKVLVSVDLQGVATPSEVIFKYNKLQAEKKTYTVKINYLEAETNAQVASSSEQSYEENSVLSIAPNPVDLKEGYQLVEGQGAIEHTLSDNFEANFYYVKKHEQVSIRVSHIDSSTGKKLIDDKEVLLLEGKNTIIAESIQEYHVMGAGSVEVQLNSGVPSLNEVVFNYEKQQKPKPVIDVYFVDEDYSTIADKQTVELVEGTNSIRAEEELGEYKLLNSAENIKYVVVTDGVPDAKEVKFVYSLKKKETEAPKVAIVKVYYKTLDGRDLLEQPLSVTCVEGEQNLVNVDTSLVDAARYAINGESARNVTVSANGEANPASIIFYFNDTYSTKGASVIVHYADENHVDIIPAFSVNVKKGMNKISFQRFEALKDYELVSAESIDVELFDDGRLSQGEVSFILRKKPAQTAAPTPTTSPKAEYKTRPVDGYVKPIREGINFRSEPIKTNDSVLRKLNAGEVMQLDGLYVAGDGSEWYYGRIGAVKGYLSKAHTKPLTKQEIADYLELESDDLPEVKPLEPIRGYAVIRLESNLMQNPGDKDVIIHSLNKDELVFATAQAEHNSEIWFKIEELRSHKIGYVHDYALNFISDEEAQQRLNAMNETPKPNQMTHQFTGLAKSNGDNVPIRNYMDTNASIVHWLMHGDVVSVHGQQLEGGQLWHVVQLGDIYGFVRADQLNALTPDEERVYIESLRVTLPPVITPQPYDANKALSSYGYANANKLRLRKQASTKSSYTKMLDEGSLLMIYSSVVGDDGKTWYKVNSEGETGFVMSEFVNVLTTKGLNEYLQKKRNESKPIGNNKNKNSNLNLAAIEDYNKEVWKDSSLAKQSFEPFKPPVTASVSFTPTPTPQTSPSVSPSTSPSMPPFDTVTAQPLQKKGSNIGSTLLGIILLAFIGGGVAYGYYMYRSNKLKQEKKNARLSRNIAEEERSRKVVDAGASIRPNAANPAARGANQAFNPNSNAQTRENGAGSPKASLFQTGAGAAGNAQANQRNDFRASQQPNGIQGQPVKPSMNNQLEPTRQLSPSGQSSQAQQQNPSMQRGQANQPMPRPQINNSQANNQGNQQMRNWPQQLENGQNANRLNELKQRELQNQSMANTVQLNANKADDVAKVDANAKNDIATGAESFGTIEFTKARPNAWPRAEELKNASHGNDLFSAKNSQEMQRNPSEAKPEMKPEAKTAPKAETISFDKKSVNANNYKGNPSNGGKGPKKRIRNY